MPSVITWEEPYKHKPYEGMPTRYTLSGSMLDIRLLNKYKGNPISTNLVPFISAKKLPTINSYVGENHTNKYDVIERVINTLIKSGVNSHGTVRDLCCYRSDTILSTTGLALSKGFCVFGYGNNIDNMTPQNNLMFCLCPDVTKLPFVGKASFDSLGKQADVSIMDACGIQSTHGPFMEKVVKYSNATIWFLSVGCGRPSGFYGGSKEYKIYGHSYPTDEGALAVLVGIISNHFKDKKYNVKSLKTKHGDYIIIITKLKINRKF